MGRFAPALLHNSLPPRARVFHLFSAWRSGIANIDKYQPDELIVTNMIHDHTSRVRSFEIATDFLTQLRAG